MHTFAIAATAENKPDFVSACIMRFIAAPYSHIAIIAPNDDVYHATGKGFHRIKLAELIDKRTMVHIAAFTLTPEEAARATGWLEGRLDTDYGELQYLGFFLPFLRKWFSNNKAKTICSEVGADFLVECLGYQGKWVCGRDFLTPKDVIEAALAFAKEKS